MTKKIFLCIMTVLLVTLTYVNVFAKCGIWLKNNDRPVVKKNAQIGGDNVPTLAIGYSSDHIEDLTFTVKLTGAEWEYQKSGTIMTGVTYTLENKNTMSVSVDVGTDSDEHNFSSRGIYIPLYCKAVQGGELKYTVDGTGTTVSSYTGTFAKCVDGSLTAGGKSKAIGNTGELNEIWIKDTSTQAFSKNSKFTLKLNSGFKFTDSVNLTATGKFEENCEFSIDSKDPTTAYVTIKNATGHDTGKITLSNLVVKRDSEAKFTSLLMNISTDAGIIKLNTNFSVASYNEDYVYTTETITETITETTTEATTSTNVDTSTAPTTTDQGQDKSKDIVIAIGAKSYKVGDKEHPLDAPAFIEDGYTMLPLRAIANAFGISDENISYNANTKTATLKDERGISVEITANESKLFVNGFEIAIDSPATIKNGRLYLPLRAIANAFGISGENINYDNQTKTVTIKR